MTKPAVDRNTTFGQILKMGPEVGDLLKNKFNMGCVGCGGADQETLAQGATAHGLDVDELIKELKNIL